MSKLIFSFAIILFGLSLGYGIQVLVNRNAICLPIPLDHLRKLLQRVALLFVNPVAIVGAVWVVNIESIRLVALPFNGLFSILAGGVFALALQGFFIWGPGKRVRCIVAGLSRTSAASVRSSASCFLVKGDLRWYRSTSYSRSFATTRSDFPLPGITVAAKTRKTLDRIKRLSKDPFILATLSSIILGGCLTSRGFKDLIFCDPSFPCSFPLEQ